LWVLYDRSQNGDFSRNSTYDFSENESVAERIVLELAGPEKDRIRKPDPTVPLEHFYFVTFNQNWEAFVAQRR
jgi:hypothetical protein